MVGRGGTVDSSQRGYGELGTVEQVGEGGLVRCTPAMSVSSVTICGNGLAILDIWVKPSSSREGTLTLSHPGHSKIAFAKEEPKVGRTVEKEGTQRKGNEEKEKKK